MKKAFAIISTFVAAASIFSQKADAQTFQSGYFLDNYVYGYRINPAIMSEKGFFGLGVSNIDLGLKSDLGVASLIYPNPEGTGLVTGLNGNISSEEFMSKIKDANMLGLDLNMNVFSVGSRKAHSMATFEVNIRGNFGASLPGDIFAFLKKGSQESAFDLSTLYGGANAFGEVALGYTKGILNDRLIIGGRVKALVGLANFNASVPKGDILVNSEAISVDVDAEVKAASNLVTIKADENGKLGISPFQMNFTPGGFGAAVDLGVMVRPLKNLTVTAAILDLGGISWNYNSKIQSQGKFSFNGMKDVDENSNLQEELNTAKEELEQLSKFKNAAEYSSSFEALPFTVNAGVRYRLPFVRFISVGALATYHNDSMSPWYDARAGITVTPLKFLSVTGNYGVSSFGNVCGGAVSVSLLFLNLFVGADAYAGPLGVYSIDGVNIPVFNGVPFPIDAFRFKVNAGLTMQFGQRQKK